MWRRHLGRIGADMARLEAALEHGCRAGRERSIRTCASASSIGSEKPKRPMPRRSPSAFDKRRAEGDRAILEAVMGVDLEIALAGRAAARSRHARRPGRACGRRRRCRCRRGAARRGRGRPRRRSAVSLVSRTSSARRAAGALSLRRRERRAAASFSASVPMLSRTPPGRGIGAEADADAERVQRLRRAPPDPPLRGTGNCRRRLRTLRHHRRRGEQRAQAARGPP